MEVWTAAGLTRYAVLFVIDLATRRVVIAGIASEPDRAWVMQCGRQLTDAVDGFLVGKRFLLHDRDPLFADAFRETLAATSVETVRLPPHSPNLNAHAERFVRTIKESCLDRLILVGERSLRHAIREFLAHYHYERNHQGMGNLLLFPVSSERRTSLLSSTVGWIVEVLPSIGRVGAGAPFRVLRVATAVDVAAVPSPTSRSLESIRCAQQAECGPIRKRIWAKRPQLPLVMRSHSGVRAVDRVAGQYEVRLFVNGENLTNVRQMQYDPLIRPNRGIDARWTVDA